LAQDEVAALMEEAEHTRASRVASRKRVRFKFHLRVDIPVRVIAISRYYRSQEVFKIIGEGLCTS
jgi:hypothetical protein